MIQFNFELRPEDFRLAWANAYQVAVLQVGALHLRFETQLVVSNRLIDRCEKLSDKSCAALVETGAFVTDKIAGAAESFESKLIKATKGLLEQSQQTTRHEIQQRSETALMVKAFQAERQAFRMERSRVFDLPLWKRLWAAYQNQR
jgi:hypothetical protein